MAQTVSEDVKQQMIAKARELYTLPYGDLSLEFSDNPEVCLRDYGCYVHCAVFVSFEQIGRDLVTGKLLSDDNAVDKPPPFSF